MFSLQLNSSALTKMAPWWIGKRLKHQTATSVTAVYAVHGCPSHARVWQWQWNTSSRYGHLGMWSITGGDGLSLYGGNFVQSEILRSQLEKRGNEEIWANSMICCEMYPSVAEPAFVNSIRLTLHIDGCKRRPTPNQAKVGSVSGFRVQHCGTGETEIKASNYCKALFILYRIS